MPGTGQRAAIRLKALIGRAAVPTGPETRLFRRDEPGIQGPRGARRDQSPKSVVARPLRLPSGRLGAKPEAPSTTAAGSVGRRHAQRGMAHCSALDRVRAWPFHAAEIRLASADSGDRRACSWGGEPSRLQAFDVPAAAERPSRGRERDIAAAGTHMTRALCELRTASCGSGSTCREQRGWFPGFTPSN